MKRIVLIFATMLIGLSSALAAGWDPNEGEKVQATIETFKKKDPDLARFFEKAHGYAVFPTVVKGGWMLGGAHGKGRVFEQGTPIGRATLSQGSVGFQLGGQSYSEIIFFKDKTALEDFKDGNLKLAAQASAIAVTAGASADAGYNNGVAVFTLPKKGLMAEASIGGQVFNFVPQK